MDTAADSATSLEASFVPRFCDEVSFVPVADEALLYVEATGELEGITPDDTSISTAARARGTSGSA